MKLIQWIIFEQNRAHSIETVDSLRQEQDKPKTATWSLSNGFLLTRGAYTNIVTALHFLVRYRVNLFLGTCHQNVTPE